jgi:uncharacterized protein
VASVKKRNLPTKITLKVRSLASGGNLATTVYLWKGRKSSAPKAYIQSSIHGSEVQGNGVIHFLSEEFSLRPPLGDVYLVPFANPQAMDRKAGEFTDGRFDPTTGDNWNRGYWRAVIRSPQEREDIDQVEVISGESEESFRRRVAQAFKARSRRELPFFRKLCLQLQTLAWSCHHVLDFHNANESIEYIYCLDRDLESSKAFGVAAAILIPPKFGGALDEAIQEPWTIWADAGGVGERAKAFTLEWGSQEILSLDRARDQARRTMNYLKRVGVVEGKGKASLGSMICADLADYRLIPAPVGGLYDFDDILGQPMKRQERIARVLVGTKGGTELREVRTSRPLFPLLHYSSSVLHEGDEMLKGFVKWKILK